MSESVPPPASSPKPVVPAATDEGASMRDRLGELARRRATRPRAIRALYAVIAAFALVYFVGTLAGWWGSPVADKVRARREQDARDAAKPPAPTSPAPAAPPKPADAPGAPR